MSRGRIMRVVALLLAGLVVVGIGASATTAAWTDRAFLQTAGTASTFDVWGRFPGEPEHDPDLPGPGPDPTTVGPWQDVGLPGSPDSGVPGLEIVLADIDDVVPNTDYVRAVELCNAGNVPGYVTSAVITGRNVLVDPARVEVDEIDLGTVIPANGCPSSPTSTDPPPHRVHGHIHFTTKADPDFVYGGTDQIIIYLTVTSGAPPPPVLPGGWVDAGGALTNMKAAPAPPVVDAPATPSIGTVQVGPISWTGLSGPASEPTPTQFCFRLQVGTTSVALAPWSIVIHTFRPPWNGVAPNQVFGLEEPYILTPAADYATSGNVVVTPANSSEWASTTQSHPIILCASPAPEPAWQPPGPTTYETTSATFYLNGNQPCVRTLTTGFSPYYVGFTATFNWKTVLDAELAAGRISQAQYNDFIDNVHWAGPSGQGATGSDFSVSVTGYAELTRNVSSLHTVTLESCSW